MTIFKMTEPFQITSRLLPGVKLAPDFTVSMEYAGKDCGHQCYRFYIDGPEGQTYESSDLASGMGGGTLQDGFESLFSFMAAAAEAFQYPDSENADLFPEWVMELCYQHSDRIEEMNMYLDEENETIYIQEEES